MIDDAEFVCLNMGLVQDRPGLSYLQRKIRQGISQCIRQGRTCKSLRENS